MNLEKDDSAHSEQRLVGDIIFNLKSVSFFCGKQIPIYDTYRILPRYLTRCFKTFMAFFNYLLILVNRFMRIGRYEKKVINRPPS